MFSGSDHLNQYTFTHLTINGKYIDNEKKIIKGNQLKASVSVTNSTDAEFRKFGEFLILNADSLYEEVSLHRKEMALGAGQTYAAEGETTIDAKWKKVVFSFRFKHDGFINAGRRHARHAAEHEGEAGEAQPEPQHHLFYKQSPASGS